MAQQFNKETGEWEEYVKPESRQQQHEDAVFDVEEAQQFHAPRPTAMLNKPRSPLLFFVWAFLSCLATLTAFLYGLYTQTQADVWNLIIVPLLSK